MNKKFIFFIFIKIFFVHSHYYSIKPRKKYHLIKLSENNYTEMFSKYRIKNSEELISESNLSELKIMDNKKLNNNSLMNMTNPFFSTIKLINYYNIQYYGYIYIGNNKQKISVIFDTGSNILWVPGTNCSSCRKKLNSYNPKSSTTCKNLNIKKNISYAIGYVDGELYNDYIFINSNNNKYYDYNKEIFVNDFNFLVVNEEKNLTGTLSDGIMGLGINNEGDYHYNFVESLYYQKKIGKASFSFILTDYESKNISRIYFGDIIENKYIQKLFGNKFNKCQIPSYSKYWECQINNEIKLNNNNNQINKSNEFIFNSNSKVIFDTGTSYIIIPKGDFLQILKYLNKNNNNSCKINQNYQLICNCQNKNNFGEISLNLGNNNYFNIKFENIIDYNKDLTYQCHFHIIVDVFDIGTWILGDSALKSNLISFNINEREIKFVQNLKEQLNNIKISKSTVLNNNDNNSYWTTFSIIYWLLGIVFIFMIISVIVYLI